MRIPSAVKTLPILLISFFMFAAAALGQTGSITGQVFDATGAIIPSASITATSVSTGLTRTVTSTSAGVYNMNALPPSVYTLTASAQGFATSTRENVTLNVAAILPVNFTLTVTGAATSIDVAGVTTAPVETDSFQLSSVVDAKQINDLPLILRDPYQLVLLSPGVVTSTNNIGGFSVNGQRERNNNFMLDGGDNNDTSVPGTQGGVSSANPDSAQEFRVITNNFDAEYGRNTGAIIDVITRGGTNKFHGDAYEFGRYNALGARDFFNTKAEGKQDPYVRNDFGASVGGPIWKDRTFFFLNGEVQRFRTTRTYSTTTPTAAFRTGKFTYIDTSTTPSTPVPVDLTTPGNPDNLSGLPFNPTIASVFALAPVGQVDNGDGVTSTYFFPSPDNLNSYNLTGRFDHKLTEKHQLTVRYIYGHSAETDPFHDEVLPGLGNSSSLGTNHNGEISIASALSANSANLLKAGYNQNQAGFFCAHAGFDSLLGTDGFGNGEDIYIPAFFSNTSGTFGCAGLGDSNSQARLSSTLSLADTFSIVKGAHSIKFGGEYRDVKDKSYDNFSSRNLLSTDNFTNYGASAYTFDNNPNSTNMLPFEDLIWGAQGSVAESQENQFFTNTGARRGTDLTYFVQHEWAAFAQDTWKVSPRLTAILGLRYSFNGVPYEKNGNFANFYGDASAPLPASGFFTFRPVGPGTGHQLYEDSYKLIEPRIGFSYDVRGDGNTAIRGGFGIFHDRVFDNLFGNAKSNPPFQANQNLFPFNPSDPLGSPTVTNIGFPGNLIPSANITNGAYLEPVVIDPKLKIPTSESYNIGIQHHIGRSMTMEVNYVGNHSTHGLREIDGAPPQQNLVQANIAAGVDPAELTFTSLYQPPTDANGNPLFAASVNNTAFFHELFQTSVVSSNYNALQVRVQGQVGGLNLTGSYSYAHGLDNGSDPLVPGAGGSGLPRNSADLGPEYGSSDSDVRHRGTVAASYDLPIGTGKTYLKSGLLGKVFEGIQISGIQQVQTGLPFDLRGTVDNLHTGLTDRPQLIGAPYPSGRGTIVATGKITGPSKAAFTNAPYGESVSIHRNAFYGPGFVNTDVVFQKTQNLVEGVKLVFRAESYNVLNHPNLLAPPASNLSIASSTFGVSTAQVGQNDGTTGARQIQGALKLVF